MSVTIGIDVGGTTTKIIGLEDGVLKKPAIVRATDQVASLFGAFGKFIDSNSLKLEQVEKILVTGVGASYITKPIYSLPTARVDEFLAIGLGGTYLSSLNEALIVSMGTGTALVRTAGETIEHIGGTGIGGGTILGLSARMLNIRDFQLIVKTAQEGSLANVDLTVGDITQDILKGLPPETTCSNFGKISDVATSGDIALGIINMVMQSIGMLAILSSQSRGISDIVLIGNLTNIPQCGEIFYNLGKMYSVNFVIPPHAEYATALGAALAYLKGKI